MVGYAPYAIFFGVAATAGLIFFSFFERFSARANAGVEKLSSLLDRAGMTIKSEEIVLGVAGGAAAMWIAITFALRPGIAFGVLLLPACGLAAAAVFYGIVQSKLRKRMDLFVNQLELALRLIGSGVRVGLGLRQALAIVVEQMPDPAKHEYTRVLGRTNLGSSVNDALDELAARMPSSETHMMARSIRIASQTGGDLCRILEHLADTIKDRRRIGRKISALTAEGRTSAMILSALPPLLTGFIAVTQHNMGHALIFTTIGHVTLAIMVVLESLGVYTLLRVLKIEV